MTIIGIFSKHCFNVTYYLVALLFCVIITSCAPPATQPRGLGSPEYDVPLERERLLKTTVDADPNGRRRSLIIFYGDDEELEVIEDREIRRLINNFYSVKMIKLNYPFDWEDSYDYWSFRYYVIESYGRHATFSFYLQNLRDSFSVRDVDNIFRYGIRITPTFLIGDSNGSLLRMIDDNDSDIYYLEDVLGEFL